jgi:hypothetical protein
MGSDLGQLRRVGSSVGGYHLAAPIVELSLWHCQLNGSLCETELWSGAVSAFEAVSRPEVGCLRFRGTLQTLEVGEVLPPTSQVDNAEPRVSFIARC